MSAPSSDPKDVARLLKLLEQVGYEAKPKEFRETLEKFKTHPEAVRALRKGVTRRGREEDRGNYLESATPGYNDWRQKQNMLDQLDLADDKVFLQHVDAARLSGRAESAQVSGRAESAPPSKEAAAADDKLAELREQVRALTERVDELADSVSRIEKRAPRGPALKPPGPG